VEAPAPESLGQLYDKLNNNMLKRTNFAQVQGGRVDKRQPEPPVKLAVQDFMLQEMESMAIDVYEEAKQHRYHAYRMAHLCKQAVKQWAKQGKLFKAPEVIQQPPAQPLEQDPAEKEPEADFYNPPPPLPVQEAGAVSDQSSIVGLH